MKDGAGRALTLRWVVRHPSNRGTRLRRAARALAFRVQSRLSPRRWLADIGERSLMWVDQSFASSFKVLCANPPDRSSMLVWRRALGSGDLFVDVGANVGSYTLWAAELGARVIAVEPDHSARRLLRENVALNGYVVRVVPLALSDRSGPTRLTAGLDSMNHLVAEGHAARTQAVWASTLDELIAGRTVAGAKIDVEGGERLVLEGGTDALAERRIRLVQLEWNDHSAEVLGEDREPVARLLESFGYRLYRPDDDGELRPVHDLGFGADVFAMPTAEPARVVAVSHADVPLDVAVIGAP